MANIRTQLVSGQRRIITKVVNGQRRVSCSCCCCAGITEGILLGLLGRRGSIAFQDWDSQNYTDGTITLTNLGFYNQLGSYSANKPSSPLGWHRTKGCLRFLCRCVRVEDSEIESEINTPYGKTAGDLDMWTDIAQTIFGDETYSGTFLYAFNFYGWRYRNDIFGNLTPSDPKFIADDSYYSIAKYEITQNT